MSGSIYRSCACADPATGKQYRKGECPRLSNPRHGAWAYVVDLPSADGRRLQSRRSGFATKKAAEQALSAVRVDLATPGRRFQRGAGSLTLGKYLDDWLAAIRSTGSVRRSTLESYEAIVRDVWKPQLGGVRLADLDPEHVEKTIRWFQARAEARGEPLRPATFERWRATLRSALSKAVRQRLIGANAAALAELPSVERPDLRPWEPEELGRFLDHVNAQGHPLAALYEVAAFAGLRRGELLGLRWEDVDLPKQRLFVRQQLLAIDHGVPVFGPPKSKAGRRKVDLP